ncbi:MAG: caspase family protein [Parachlamydiales bacterium]|jgi:hypothetical protein
MQRLFLCVILLSLHILPLGAAEAKTIHALLVCDTTEYLAGISAQRDCEKMNAELERAAHFSGMKTNIVKLTGKEATPRKLFQTLKKIDVKSKDTFVFYFSGHGYHPEDKQGSRWPYLYFSLVGKMVPLQEVLDEITAKKPRLAIVFADSCNNYLDNELLGNIVFHKSLLVNPVTTLRKLNGYKKLFLQSKGLLIGTAVTEGGYAEATDEGGLYTETLLSVIRQKVLEAEALNWTNVMLHVREKMIQANKPIPDFHFEQ